MASATARLLLPFTFHHHPPTSQTSIFIKPPHFLLSNPKPTTLLRVSSLDLSKEDDDKPQSETNQTDPDPDPDPDPETEFQRPSERFAVLNSGVYECRSCGYRYETAAGDPSYPIPPGFDFYKLPDDWRCPTCGAAKSFFVTKSVEIAGFAENQQFGFGANTLTSAQKAVLIYGSLLLFFCLFLSGYFLQ